MSDATQLTKTGNLEPKIANAACYIPILGIGPIASIVFLATEEKDSERIRFHAAQALGLYASIFVGSIVYSVLTTVISIGASIIDSILGTNGMISLLGVLFTLLLTLLFLAAVLIVPFGAAALAFLEKRVRIPVLAGLIERVIGHGDGWTE